MEGDQENSLRRSKRTTKSTYGTRSFMDGFDSSENKDMGTVNSSAEETDTVRPKARSSFGAMGGLNSPKSNTGVLNRNPESFLGPTSTISGYGNPQANFTAGSGTAMSTQPMGYYGNSHTVTMGSTDNYGMSHQQSMGSHYGFLNNQTMGSVWTSNGPIPATGYSGSDQYRNPSNMGFGDIQNNQNHNVDKLANKVDQLAGLLDQVITQIPSMGKGPMKRQRREASESTESESDGASQSTDRSDSNRSSHRRFNQCRLPPFTGKERWEVWFNRFDEMASRLRWNNDRRLDELLPKIQGQAGEFVFSQLSHEVRNNYKKLVSELDSRFKVVEVAKTFQAKFSKRSQKMGESVEEYAAELKRLYDKAYINRPSKIRQEDLLRRFLDGLSDNRARQQVEFVKEPTGIDEAVVEVVTFLESQKKISDNDDQQNKNKKRFGMVRPAEDESDSTESDAEANEDDQQINRVPEAGSKNKNRANNTGGSNMNLRSNSSEQQKSKVAATPQISTPASSEMKQIVELLNAIKSEQDNLKADQQKLQEKFDTFSSTKENQNKTGGKSYKGKGSSTDYKARQNNEQINKSTCFRCGLEGHYAKACPFAPWIAGQMQLAYQPIPVCGAYTNTQPPTQLNAMNGTNTQPMIVNPGHTSTSQLTQPIVSMGMTQMPNQQALN